MRTVVQFIRDVISKNAMTTTIHNKYNKIISEISGGVWIPWGKMIPLGETVYFLFILIVSSLWRVRYWLAHHQTETSTLLCDNIDVK